MLKFYRLPQWWKECEEAAKCHALMTAHTFWWLETTEQREICWQRKVFFNC